jgi:hypothetical protein
MLRLRTKTEQEKMLQSLVPLNVSGVLKSKIKPPIFEQSKYIIKTLDNQTLKHIINKK